MNKRLQKMIDNCLIPNMGGVFIDAYNQSINEDIAGTITTRVDASNMIYVTETEPTDRVIQVGNIRDSKDNPQSGRIYSAEGIAPTIDTCMGGGENRR